MNRWNISVLFLLFTFTNFRSGRCLPRPAGLESEESLNNIALLRSEVRDKWIKEPCLKNGGQAAFDHFMAEVKKSQKCLEGSVNFRRSELEEVALKDTFDTVLHGYCKKLPTIKDCMGNLWNAAEACLPESERGSPNVTKNMTEGFMDFFCLKEGDYFASFLKEGGPDCMTEKSTNLLSCVSSTLEKYPSLSEAGKESNNWSKVKSKDQDCRATYDLEQCIMKELKGCKTQTAADFVGTLFRMLNEKSPCQEKENQLKK